MLLRRTFGRRNLPFQGWSVTQSTNSPDAEIVLPSTTQLAARGVETLAAKPQGNRKRVTAARLAWSAPDRLTGQR